MQRFIIITTAVVTAMVTSAVVQAADANVGKTKFQQLCASCHGVSGKGDGAASAALKPKPRNFSDATYMKSRTDADLKKVIMEGGPAVGKSASMPPWKASLQGSDLDNIIAYIRTLSK